eukprot:CAMPEP_0202075326 /NCGR_PEP_ID=MMETSP0964-20121228/4144_1 /ASSEMBLY_ACC=CAM_ASM_000500 /TAXON_ID=4773 /ORGANISM="Schizochytrium aggregatum, Strain ATCC28209" /LENGTH=49 /DNA_ID= /DNA_START= /DNA_END= /DNA_ORIENTATION=
MEHTKRFVPEGSAGSTALHLASATATMRRAELLGARSSCFFAAFFEAPW